MLEKINYFHGWGGPPPPLWENSAKIINSIFEPFLNEDLKDINEIIKHNIDNHAVDATARPKLIRELPTYMGLVCRIQRRFRDSHYQSRPPERLLTGMLTACVKSYV